MTTSGLNFRRNNNFFQLQLKKLSSHFSIQPRYLDDLLNIDNTVPILTGMVNQIYPSELQLNKANSSDTEAQFLDFHLTV